MILLRLLAASILASLLMMATAEASVTISNIPTKHMRCTSGICTPTATNAYLNVRDLVAMLAVSDVTVKSNATASDIRVASPLAWTSSHRLTLDAYQSIHVLAPVMVEGTSGLTLTTNDGGTGGSYDFRTSTAGSIRFWDTASSLVINGAAYTLASDLKMLANQIGANPEGNYALANSYDATADGTYSGPAITAVLEGTLDGLGNSISHLKIDTGPPRGYEELGLFSYLFGTLRDLGLPYVTIASENTGSPNVAGALAAVNGGTIINCFATGRIIFRGEGSVGGLVGENNSGSIWNSHASVKVVASGSASSVGGMVGAMGYPATISGSYATGSVSWNASGGAVGGLVGFNDGTIVDSYAMGAVLGGKGSRTGGLVGATSNATMRTSYAAGAVAAAPGRQTLIGGLVGDNQVTQVLQSVWDTTASGISNCTGYTDHGVDCTGVTTAQLKSGLPAGFDPAVWGQNASINNGYPYLLANPPQ
jgi:hypothetical protein